jgi:FkbM family methyltransferase
MIPLFFKALYLPLLWGIPQPVAEFYARLVRQLLLRVRERHTVKTPFGFPLQLNGKDFIQRHILFYKIWEPSISFWIDRSISEGDVFCDVGANIGYFSQLAARKIGASGKVIALEASPSIYGELRASTRNQKNIECINIAVGNKSGTTPIYKDLDDNSGLSSIFKDAASTNLVLEADVKMATLDQILASANCPTPRLIKIDVEGAEWMVIEGMRQTIESENPQLEIIVEFDAKRLEQFRVSPDTFFEWFKKRGFFPYDMHNHYLSSEYFPQTKIPVPTPLNGIPKVQTDILFSRQPREMIASKYPQVSVGEFIDGG